MRQNNEKLYEVEHILKMKIKDDKRYFRVKWVGYSSLQNTWEPEENLNSKLINAFLEN